MKNYDKDSINFVEHTLYIHQNKATKIQLIWRGRITRNNNNLIRIYSGSDNINLTLIRKKIRKNRNFIFNKRK